ncbi:ABC transporter substrate-binding protein [Natrarchaeobius sp. A-rgal3]|uniref:ABC transporter substrate-binding protein n=1 Tax=Natrarchaeobius versutus TaxID=1679078 RepID=UPI00350FB1FE
MSSSATDRRKSEAATIDRRRLLQGIAATGIAAGAGCAGEDEEDDDETIEDDEGTQDDEDDAALEDVQDGGRLELAIERPGMDHVDYVMSTLADDSIIYNAIYDDVYEMSLEGELHNWMAEEYELVEAQDVDELDYEPYMRELEIEDVEEDEDTGEFEPALEEVDWPNTVLIHHPEDMAAVAEGELEAGDSVRALTREEAGEAVEDGVYGTHLRGRFHEGIEFHDGTELTAGDLIGSYDRHVDSMLHGQVVDAFLHADAPEGENGYEFELYHQLPDAGAELEAPVTIFPEDQHDVPPGELEPEEWVGTGPYEIVEYDEGEQVLLERMDNYWLEEVGLDGKEWWDGPEDFPEAPVIDEINVRFVPEEGTRVAGLQDGSVDLAYELPAVERDAFDDNPDFTVDSQPATGFKFMTFPMEETDTGGAFANQEVRQAVANLIPRQQIVDVVDAGWGEPGLVPIPEPPSALATQGTYEELTESDWALPADPDHEAAEEMIEESPLEAPIDIVIETNADDETRQDKVTLIVDELNASGLFDATMETPADIGDWTVTMLEVDGSRFDYSERNAATVIGLAGTWEPHGYNEAIHDPDNHNICCNWFFPAGTFDWMDDYRACRFSVDAAEDDDTRREMYDEIWPTIVEESATTMVDFSLETAVAGPDVEGFNVYVDRRQHVEWSLHAPYDEQLTWLDRAE